MTVQIVETDYNSYFEYANVSLDDILIGSCKSLSEQCTYTWKTCTNIQNYDSSGYVDYTNSYDAITLNITVSNEVNVCPYSSSYYLYGSVTLSCHNASSTLQLTHPPTRLPTESPSDGPTQHPISNPSLFPSNTPTDTHTISPSKNPYAISSTNYFSNRILQIFDSKNKR